MMKIKMMKIKMMKIKLIKIMLTKMNEENNVYNLKNKYVVICKNKFKNKI